MSHFALDSAISDATKMDAPIQRGPLMRWQRKAMESGVKSLSLEGGLNVSGLSGPLSGLSGPRSSHSLSARTPGKTPRSPLNSVTPGRTNILINGRTPGKTPGKKIKHGNSKTPNKGTSTTPHRSKSMDNLDRFIPNRAAMDMDAASFRLTNSENFESTNEEGDLSESDYRKRMSEALNDGKPVDEKILAFKKKAPQAKEGHMNNLKVLYSGSGHTSTTKPTSTRQIPQQPERILDAPELLDDYYLNLIDWSVNNHIALALGSAVYLWNASNGSINQVMELENSDEYVSCVSWIKEGNIIAVANSTGGVQLWDVGQEKLIRSMGGHSARVGSMSWNSYILSSGSRSGQIFHHDVRIPQHHVSTLQSHTQEVCGLSWSPDGKLLASGGNDNVLNIWDAALGHPINPLHTFTHHQAAVKALAWCPWSPSLLASGGGTADRNIRFWNVTTGSLLNSIDTNSQVCALQWSKEYKELISGHGFSNNQLTIWKYPSLVRVAELTGHTSRILGLCMSPDGTTVASAAADETLRIWKCFQVDKQRKPSVSKSVKTKSSLLSKGIR